jgi:hypothetical protein
MSERASNQGNLRSLKDLKEERNRNECEVLEIVLVKSVFGRTWFPEQDLGARTTLTKEPHQICAYEVTILMKIDLHKFDLLETSFDVSLGCCRQDFRGVLGEASVRLRTECQDFALPSNLNSPENI